MVESNNAVEIAEIKGLLIGIKEDTEEMKKDIIHIKNNDKDKIQRISKLETEQELLEKWRTGHIQANKETKKEVDQLDQKLDDYINSENKWGVGIIVTLALALFDLAVRFLFR
jgi:hypothetical protein